MTSRDTLKRRVFLVGGILLSVDLLVMAVVLGAAASHLSGARIGLYLGVIVVDVFGCMVIFSEWRRLQRLRQTREHHLGQHDETDPRQRHRAPPGP